MSDETKRIFEEADARAEEQRQRDVTPCSDGHCILGHPGGMHTNGGCRHLKYHRDEHCRVIRNLAGEVKRLRAELKQRSEPSEVERAERDGDGR